MITVGESRINSKKLVPVLPRTPKLITGQLHRTEHATLRKTMFQQPSLQLRETTCQYPALCLRETMFQHSEFSATYK
jgi:hypothetical protein